MADVLVVGGTGFAGRHAAAAFTHLGRDVLVLARKPGPHPAGARLVTMDLAAAGPESVLALLDTERPDVVVNAAGSIWNATSEQLAWSNVVLVEHLLAALRRASGRPRLVHLSSSYEYAPTSPGTPMTEQSPIGPGSEYAQTKAQGTGAVLDAARRRDVDAVALRVSTVIGPGAPAVSLIGSAGRVLRTAGKNGQYGLLRLYSEEAEHDFIDAFDLADAVTAAAASSFSGVVNVGGGAAVRVRSVLEQLISISEIPALIVTRPPAWETVRDGSDWQVLDISLARRELGWAPRRGVADSLRSFWLSEQYRSSSQAVSASGA